MARIAPLQKDAEERLTDPFATAEWERENSVPGGRKGIKPTVASILVAEALSAVKDAPATPSSSTPSSSTPSSSTPSSSTPASATPASATPAETAGAATEATAPTDEKPVAPLNPAHAKARILKELSRMASEGHALALTRLKGMLDADPSIWRAAGNLGAVAERAWAERAAGGDIFETESILRRQREWKAELAGDSPSPIVKALVDLFGVCWLEVQDASIVNAGAGGPLSLPESALRRVESATKRLTQVVKTLAIVRGQSDKGRSS
jgi:hypothetical protein